MSLYFCLRETADITAFIAGASPLQAEPVSISAALGRVLAADTFAPVPCPSTRRSTRDGYAVRAADIAGASPATPVLLHMTGESRMGKPCGGTLQQGEAWRVYTGSTLPEGADAVLMQEYAALGDQSAESKDAPPMVAISAPCAAEENILAPGADMPQGALLAQAGTKLGAHHMALLAQFFKEVPLHRKPLLGVLSTGDEFCGSAPQNDFARSIPMPCFWRGWPPRWAHTACTLALRRTMHRLWASICARPCLAAPRPAMSLWSLAGHQPESGISALRP